MTTLDTYDDRERARQDEEEDIHMRRRFSENEKKLRDETPGFQDKPMRPRPPRPHYTDDPDEPGHKISKQRCRR